MGSVRRQAEFPAGEKLEAGHAAAGISQREKFPAGSEFAGNSDLFAKKCAEKALDYKGLRQNSLRGRAGNYFAPSRECAGNFLRRAGNFAPAPKTRSTRAPEPRPASGKRRSGRRLGPGEKSTAGRLLAANS